MPQDSDPTPRPQGEARPVQPPPKDQAAPPMGYAAYPPPPWWCDPPKRRSGLKRLGVAVFITLFVLSILVNIDLMILLMAGKTRGLESTTMQEGAEEQTIAVFHISDMITEETSTAFGRFYREVRDNENIKAVLLRVNSPGGMVGPSDRIHQMAKDIRLKLNKPVVVSMGGVAASGAYYISVAADEIFAEPTTATGSIGVIAVVPVAGELLDKIGLKMLTIRSTQALRWKMRLNYWEKPQQRVMQEHLDLLNDMHEEFVQVVRMGRGDRLKTQAHKVTTRNSAGEPVAYEEIEPLNGRVYTAKHARTWGLIDQVGYMDQAIEAAGARAKLGNPRVVQYHPPRSLLSRLGMSGGKSVLDADRVQEYLTPRIMMLWKPEVP
jgi:protease-4